MNKFRLKCKCIIFKVYTYNRIKIIPHTHKFNAMMHYEDICNIACNHFSEDGKTAEVDYSSFRVAYLFNLLLSYISLTMLSILNLVKMKLYKLHYFKQLVAVICMYVHIKTNFCIGSILEWSVKTFYLNAINIMGSSHNDLSAYF